MNGQSTSRFQAHEPCEKCGSRDNFARYSSGSGYCFGCGAFQAGSVQHAERYRQVSNLDSKRSELSTDHIRPPPDDIGTYYGRTALDWLQKYNIGVETLIKHHVKWSPSREQLIYLFYGAGTDVVMWQARNFRAGVTHKDRFFTGGSPADVLAAYHPVESSNTIIIVEDCVSGIKCAEAGFVGVPCFSAAMPKQKLSRLKRYYSNVVVWLDEDKLKESQKLATQCSLLGFHSKVVHTELDPKEYQINKLQELVNG